MHTLKNKTGLTYPHKLIRRTKECDDDTYTLVHPTCWEHASQTGKRNTTRQKETKKTKQKQDKLEVKRQQQQQQKINKLYNCYSDWSQQSVHWQLKQETI